MEVHPTERELLLRIRKKFRFGEILIEAKDGLPYRIGRTVEYERLNSPMQEDEELSTL